MRRIIILFICIGILCLSSVADATIYVDVDQTGAEDGTSWGTAYNTIQEGIDAAAGGEEVWIAEGTYYIYSSSTSDTVSIGNGVHLYGGFAGTEGNKDARDPDTHVTIIDGHASAGSTNQVSHVVTFSESTTVSGYSATIDGFTITGGKALSGPAKRKMQPRATSVDAIFNTLGEGSGGGMLIWRASPTVSNCIITGNSAGKGGGVYVMVGTEFPASSPNPAPSFTDCTFSNNSASMRGGGVSNDVATHPTFTRSTFTNNTCDAKGGAMYNDFGCSPTLINCLIAQNTSERASAMGCDGTSSPKLVNCTVTDNYAYDVGAGIYTGSYLAGPNEPILVNCIVWGNENQWGGPEDFNVWHENHFYISYSLIGNGFTSNGEGVLQGDTADPLFVDPTNGDYRLQSTSPCINSGTGSDADVPVTDLDGSTRDSMADMGAFEYTGTTTTGTLTVTISPPEAVTAGAQWTVNGATYESGTPATLSEGNYTVSYTSVTGYTTPADASVTITSGGAKTLTATYTESTSTSDAFTGYTLYMPIPSKTAYLLDINGNSVHTWTSTSNPALAVYLLEDGSLLQTAKASTVSTANFTTVSGGGGKVMKLSSDGTETWSFDHSNDTYQLHHDIEYMDNGNILMIAWEYKSYDEAVAAGRNPANVETGVGLYPDKIIEVDSGGSIVWEWHVWDHLVQEYDNNQNNFNSVADHPELIDINFVTRAPDITHFNSIDYNEELDQILVSVHSYSEIWVIDHSTATAEAAGHTGGNSGKGGDLLYRWGNPRAYDAGTSSDQKLYSQHDATWIESGYPGEGNILIFNNGGNRSDGTSYSSVEEITTPVDTTGSYSLKAGSAYEPSIATWTYNLDSNYYSSNISGVQRLPNGNTLICSGANGYFLEVDSSGQTVWEYTVSGGTDVFKVQRYGADYPGLSGLVNTGSLTVSISPDAASTAGAQWNLDGGEWHDAGTLTVAAGTYRVNFSDVTNYTTPASQSVTVASGGTASVTGTYVSTQPETGKLTVTIEPTAAANAGAQWTLDNSTYYNSGNAATLTVGDYTVSFTAVTGYDTPANQSVTVTSGGNHSLTGTYTEQPGSLLVNISPSGAIEAGAQWSVNGNTYDNGSTVSLTAGTYTISFTEVYGYDTPASQNVTLTAGGSKSLIGEYVQQTGSLKVTITPPEAVTDGAQWSIDGGTTWNGSGTTLSDLAVGTYTVGFSTVAGWGTPGSKTATVSDGTTATATGTYTSDTGSVRITISPQEAIDAGAQWSVDDGATWQNSGDTISGLAPDSQIVTFKTVNLWDSPQDLTVTITAGGTIEDSGTYTETVYTLSDAITLLQMLCGITAGTTSFPDPSGNGSSGIEDVIYVLQYVSGLR